MNDEQELMLADCMQRESKLTEWEAGFLDSISHQDRPLSPRQAETLEAVWERVTS